MLLCCPVCGNSFHSDNKETKCEYCFSDTEVLFTDDELQSIAKEELTIIAEISKEKYKNESNPKYNCDMWSAREAKDASIVEREKISKFYSNLSSHMTTTCFNFEGYKITKYVSVISGNVVLGTGLFTEWVASVDDFLGTTSSPYENKMEKAKEIALEKLKRKSSMLGGNAIIGIDFDFFTVGNNMIAVSANGTSVVIEKV